MPSTRTVTFSWNGTEYQIPKLLADEAVEFLEAQEQNEELLKSDVRSVQIKAALSMIDLLRCPEEIRASLGIDEIEDCLFGLIHAQMPRVKGTAESPTPPAGGVGGNGKVPLTMGADSLPASPGSTETVSAQ